MAVHCRVTRTQTVCALKAYGPTCLVLVPCCPCCPHTTAPPLIRLVGCWSGHLRGRVCSLPPHHLPIWCGRCGHGWCPKKVTGRARIGPKHWDRHGLRDPAMLVNLGCGHCSDSYGLAAQHNEKAGTTKILQRLCTQQAWAGCGSSMRARTMHCTGQGAVR